MKTTVEIADELYRKSKAEAALRCAVASCCARSA